MITIVRYIFGNVLYLFSLLVPKSDNIWVFGSWGGSAFADNPKYLYDYVRNNQGHIRPVWLTRSRSVLQELRSEGHEVHLIASLLGLYYMMRASYGVTSHGITDLNRYAVARIKIVETWHGIPIKPVLLSDPKKKARRKFKVLHFLKFFFPFLAKEVDFKKLFLICGSGPLTNELCVKIFGEGIHLASVGFPRLDGLKNINTESTLVNQLRNFQKDGFRLMIYLPTYRREAEFDIIGFFRDNLSFINDNLVSRRIKLFVKFHPFDAHKIDAAFESKSVFFLSDRSIGNDIYGILGLFDMLVTDYSSVLFDYLYLGRPVYLLTPDRDSYIKSNGNFVFDYLDLGIPLPEDWRQLFLLLDHDYPIERITQLQDQFHVAVDNRNSERLFKEIVKH